MGVNFNKPRKGQFIGINNAPNAPMEPRPIDGPPNPIVPPPTNPFAWYPGEDPNTPSDQAQSWIDAGEDFSRLNEPRMGYTGDFKVGNPLSFLDTQIDQEANRAAMSNFFQPLTSSIKNAWNSAQDWYEQNIFPFTPGAQGDLLSRSVDNYLTALKANFNQGPDGGNVGSGSSAGEAAVDQNPPTTMAAPEDNFFDYWQKAQDYLNANAPDYSGVQDRWIDEGNLTNARIQAMYDQIASRAGENVQRVSDIYSGASEGIGSVYDTASANTEQAYASAQQQAADQMARLGIEAAAPAVLNPAALSQAEAVANLESGRASGLGATERYGASSGDFASQMAQVAQQEGAQYQTSVTDALRRQMMNLEMQQQQDAYQRAMQAPGLAQQLQSVSQLNQEQGLTPEQQLAYERFAFEQGQAAADIALEQERARNVRYQELYALFRDSDKAEEQLNYEISIGRI